MTVPYRHRGIAETRREDVRRIDAMTVKVTRVTGYVLIEHETDVAAAESSVDLQFPVVFTEKPVFTFGSELAENHRALATEYPTLSATVARWESKGEVIGATLGRFVGAHVVVVSTGQVGQHIWLHYSFEGKAIRNPITPMTDDLGEEI